MGTFQPTVLGNDYPFNMTAVLDCNTTVVDKPLLMHADPQPKWGFSVNWYAGRWRRWNNILVKIEAVGGFIFGGRELDSDLISLPRI